MSCPFLSLSLLRVSSFFNYKGMQGYVWVHVVSGAIFYMFVCVMFQCQWKVELNQAEKVTFLLDNRRVVSPQRPQAHTVTFAPQSNSCQSGESFVLNDICYCGVRFTKHCHFYATRTTTYIINSIQKFHYLHYLID